jgi:hypothetical protein
MVGGKYETTILLTKAECLFNFNLTTPNAV